MTILASYDITFVLAFQADDLVSRINRFALACRADLGVNVFRDELVSVGLPANETSIANPQFSLGLAVEGLPTTFQFDLDLTILDDAST